MFLTEVSQISVSGCSFHNNTAPHSQGGALRVRFSGASLVQDCDFVKNSALSGGAISISNMNMGSGEVFAITNTSLSANAAFFTPSLCPGDYCIVNDDTLVPGNGGAIEINGCPLVLSGVVPFVLNSAQGRGGAIFAELPFDNSYIQILSVSVGGGSNSSISSMSGNTARVSGGAVALRGYPLYISSAPFGSLHQPTVGATPATAVFSNNSAPTGGAISVFQSSVVQVNNAWFVNNRATQATSHQSVTDEGGVGHGGAVCIVGGTASYINITSAFVSNNSASFGGGLAIHASPSCTSKQQSTGCFRVDIDGASQFVSNSAVEGAGGAVFWSHLGDLNMSCSSQGRLLPAAMSATSRASGINMPCASWDGNTVTAAGYGPVIASTPFYLDPVERKVPYYTSNQPLLLNVTVQVRAKERLGKRGQGATELSEWGGCSHSKASQYLLDFHPKVTGKLWPFNRLNIGASAQNLCNVCTEQSQSPTHLGNVWKWACVQSRTRKTAPPGKQWNYVQQDCFLECEITSTRI